MEYINDNKNIRNFNSKPNNFEAYTEMDLPIDWENAFENDEDASQIQCETASDGLIYSLKNLGRVDIEYIAKIANLGFSEVIERLKGAIYQDPNKWNGCFYKGFVTADEYLSGNLFYKLREANAASKKYNGYFDDNIDALKNVLPKSISYNEIYYTLSSPWIPKDMIKDFIINTLNVKHYVENIIYDEMTACWDLKNVYYQYSFNYLYGTSRITAAKLLEKILNLKSLAIYDSLTSNGKKKHVINKPETLLIEEKAKKLQELFKDFINSDENRKNRLIDVYNEKYAYNAVRLYNGSFLEFKDMNPDYKLFDHQKNAVARIIFNSNTLLAHNVGAGKTYVMISAGMELVRLGYSKKNLYVVPNNIVTQWKNLFLDMYPNAKLLALDTKDFTPDKKRNTLLKIRDGEYDNIIIPYSSFDRIELANSVMINKLQSKLAEIEEYIRNNDNLSSGVYSLWSSVEKQLTKLLAEPLNPNDDVSFDKLGITRLFLDEAHNYKNVPLVSNLGNIKGINTAGSAKCLHMQNIVEFINSDENNGIIMATGTPITNSITDCYVFQSYLQSGELKLLDINSFDNWVAMFAEGNEELEIDLDTNGYRTTTRFSRFHNLPELTSILASIADFNFSNGIINNDLPEFNGYTDVVLPKSYELAGYLNEISRRVEFIRAGVGSRKDDNLLKVTTDGRKAALDLRLIDYHKYCAASNLKVYKCAEIVSSIYLQTKENKSTQLIFCDSSTPKDSFNLYDELKRILVNIGINPNEIAFVHDASTENQRERLFSKVRRGEIRILIGSTFKLGMGVNVQDKLIAIHHLDVPWRPADMIQREGRIIRLGNTNDEVFIYRYISEGSFDAYSWQLLEIKQNFINELLSNSVTQRAKEDISDIMLSYGEVKALAIGNPELKEHVDLKNQLNKLKMLSKKSKDRYTHLKLEQQQLPNKIAEMDERNANIELDLAHYLANKKEYDKEYKQELRRNIYFSLMDYLYKDNERVLLNYQGFDLILPKNLVENKLYIILTANNRYVVEIGNSEIGTLIRIDNFLEGLSEYLDKNIIKADELRAQLDGIALELDNMPDYSEAIERIAKKIENIERKLDIDE